MSCPYDSSCDTTTNKNKHFRWDFHRKVPQNLAFLFYADDTFLYVFFNPKVTTLKAIFQTVSPFFAMFRSLISKSEYQL